MPYTLHHAQQLSLSDGRIIEAAIPTGDTYGILLTVRPGTTGVLSMEVVDQFGEATYLALTVPEAARLRSALAAWAAGQGPTPDPWTDPDGAAALNPPPF